jgi:hypothetical protein
MCTYFVLLTISLSVFVLRCRPDQVHVAADVAFALLPLGLGLLIAVFGLIAGQFSLHSRIDGVCQAIDGLNSGVNVESVRMALDMAISVLDDPAPGRIDIAKRVLSNVMADLPEPPATQSGTEE